MARVKEATFNASVTPSEIDPDSPTFRRSLQTTQGNLALIFDKVSGQNGETEVCDHSGVEGRGSLLGIPWINQAFGGRDDRYGQFGADLTYTNALVGAKGDGSFGSDTAVCAVPVFVPPGEKSFRAMIVGRGLDLWPWRLKVVDEANAATVLLDVHLQSYGGALLMIDAVNISGLDDGLRLFYLIADTTKRQLTDGTTPDGQVRMNCWTVSPMRQRTTPQMPLLRSASDFGVTAPTGTQRLVFRDFDDTLFEDTAVVPGSCLPISGYHTGGMNRSRNALEEYIRRFPVGGNAAFTQADSGAVNPTTSRFMSHSRAGAAGGDFPNEPLLHWPLFAEAFGAAMLDGHFVTDNARPPTLGMLDHYAYDPVAVASTVHRNWRMYLPDFPTGADSILHACVLGISPNAAEAVKWSAEWVAASASGTAAFAAVTGSSVLFTAKHALVNFSSDQLNTIQMKLEKSAVKVSDDIRILGACMYFDY